jgi:hypothetical protein
MQERDFDDLLAGKPAKWADIPEGIPLNRVTKEFVEQNKKPVPQSTVTAVDIWVDRCRKLGYL